MSDPAARFAERRKKLLATSRVRMQRVTLGQSPVSKADLAEAARKAEAAPDPPAPSLPGSKGIRKTCPPGDKADGDFEALDLARGWTRKLDLVGVSAQRLSALWAFIVAAAVEVWGPQVGDSPARP